MGSFRMHFINKKQTKKFKEVYYFFLFIINFEWLFYFKHTKIVLMLGTDLRLSPVNEQLWYAIGVKISEFTILHQYNDEPFGIFFKLLFASKKKLVLLQQSLSANVERRMWSVIRKTIYKRHDAYRYGWQ